MLKKIILLISMTLIISCGSNEDINLEDKTSVDQIESFNEENTKETGIAQSKVVVIPLQEEGFNPNTDSIHIQEFEGQIIENGKTTNCKVKYETLLYLAEDVWREGEMEHRYSIRISFWGDSGSQILIQEMISKHSGHIYAENAGSLFYSDNKITGQENFDWLTFMEEDEDKIEIESGDNLKFVIFVN